MMQNASLEGTALDGQTAWLPGHARDADPSAYPQVSGVCEPCDRLDL
jgi:hypothetical protein